MSENVTIEPLSEEEIAAVRQDMYGSGHWRGCWRRHWDCQAARLLASIDALRARAEAAERERDARRERKVTCENLTAAAPRR